MNKKLISLMFGLLLAVGWTSSAYAQLSPNNIPDAVYPKSYYDTLTYTWENPTDGVGLRISKSTDLATDPYQIYELLRFVYGNPAFPGPKYGAYTSGFVREDPITYGPVQGRWNIVDAASANPRNITIDVTNDYSWGWSTTYYYVYIQSIRLIDTETNETFFTWTPTSNTLPSGVTTSNNRAYSNNNGIYFNNGTGGTITLDASLTTGHNNVQLVIAAKKSQTSNYTTSITVSDNTKNVTSTNSSNFTWDFALPAAGKFVQGTVATPYEEGYTALIVSVYDNASPAEESTAGGATGNANGSYYNTKQKYVDYIAARIKSVQLLTDGLRIGTASEHTSGTVFNCSGTYNKFFIIGKGRAREKSDYTKNNYSNWYTGEVFPFQDMFEEFSPTVTDKGAEINDFYTEMQDGHVYSVVHDCASVIQERHQFSMSGNNGTQSYAMSGLNFFIPDYRLLYWNNPEFYFTNSNGEITDYTPYSIDGRDINPYLLGDENGKTGYSIPGHSGSAWACWFGNYNPDYAPKVGIYKITLEANAKKSAGYNADDPNKRYYDVTLNWVSSLNELSGEMVPQTYIIYQVTYNEDGTETQTPLDTVYNETTYTYQVLQTEESQTITYIIKGYPTPSNDSNYPSFVAWSNLDDVVIPGLNDFLNLILDHYESDFVIGNAIGTEKNYYRNFMHVAAENEDNALTVERINAGEKYFTLYRYDMAKPEPMIPVGKLNFWDNRDGKTVGYGFSFDENNPQVVEDYTLKTNDNQTITNAYSHDKLGMPVGQAGYDLRIKGNGDIVIQPNGYDVNFYEISVYNGNSLVAHWQVSNGNVTSLGWYLSPGSKWVRDAGTNYYYLEGGGFIAIPNMLNNNQLRVVINASRDEGKLGQIKVNDHTMTVNSTSAQNYEWTLTDKYYKYVRVLNSSDLTAGEYLIVNENDSVIFDGSKGVLDAAYNNLSVEITSTGSTNEIAESSLIDNATFTIDPAAGTVKSASGYYIGLTANSNGLRQSTDPITNAISVDGNEAHIKTTATSTVRELRYNNTQSTTGKRFRYYPENTQQKIQLYKKVETTKPAGESIVRLGSLPIIDQFAVSVANNQHPNRYAYVLKYEPDTANADPTYENYEEVLKPKTSSHVEVPVQKTGSVVNGFYTEAQVEQDKDNYNTVKIDNVDADMQMTLTNTNSAVFYYSILNNNAAVPQIDKDSTYYVSNLQNDNFVYQEMFKHSPNAGRRYQAGEHHYFDSVYVKGSYGNMGETYVPFVTSRAIERFYFVEDSLHNTYGSPIWATSAGKIDLSGTEIERQEGKWSVWTYADTVECSEFRVAMDAKCYLPSPTASNVPYEPYLCRVWVNYNNLRDYHKAANGFIVDDGKHEGDLMWLADIPVTADMYKADGGYYHVVYGTIGQQNSYTNQLIFGADNKANPEMVVRFYYKAKGATTAPNTFNANRDAYVPKMYNAAETKFTDDNIGTAVRELNFNGEVVSRTYVNPQGMQSDKPFNGVNIVITRYSDGTATTTKVIR